MPMNSYSVRLKQVVEEFNLIVARESVSYTHLAAYRAALDAGCLPAGRLLGSGNGLRRNPALQRAVERSFGLPLTLAAVPEEAACGAALFARMGMQEAF